MDNELSSSTLLDTFERNEAEDGTSTLADVNVEENLLKNFLESHASQMGSTGNDVLDHISTMKATDVLGVSCRACQ